MKPGSWMVVVAVGWVGLHAEIARAEEPAAAAPAVSAPDVVRLKNGGLLRGTISELVPGQTVTIVTASGKTRELPMAEVDYAGPADKDPQVGAGPAVPTATAAPAAATAPAAASAQDEPKSG